MKLRSSKLMLMGAALGLLAAGCSVHRTRVDCEGTLRPINAPAPAATFKAPTGASNAGGRP
jgi:hypothetical protein